VRVLGGGRHVADRDDQEAGRGAGHERPGGDRDGVPRSHRCPRQHDHSGDRHGQRDADAGPGGRHQIGRHRAQAEQEQPPGARRPASGGPAGAGQREPDQQRRHRQRAGPLGGGGVLVLGPQVLGKDQAGRGQVEQRQHDQAGAAQPGRVGVPRPYRLGQRDGRAERPDRVPGQEVQRGERTQAEPPDPGRIDHGRPVVDVPVRPAEQRLVDHARLEHAGGQRQGRDARPAQPAAPGQFPDQHRRRAVERDQEEQPGQQLERPAGAGVVRRHVLRADRREDQENQRLHGSDGRGPRTAPETARSRQRADRGRRSASTFVTGGGPPSRTGRPGR
jgi:hypothetical protein